MGPERTAALGQPQACLKKPAKPFYRMSRPEARAQVRAALLALLSAFQPMLRKAPDDPEKRELPWAI